MVSEYNFRSATRNDLPTLVKWLADDHLGMERDIYTEPLDESYIKAFQVIDKDPFNDLLLIEEKRVLLGFCQLTFIPNLTYKGRFRALIEGVRVSSDHRGKGLGKLLIGEAIRRSQEKNCVLVQLTTDKKRDKAIKFYESMGFIASHEGMKLFL